MCFTPSNLGYILDKLKLCVILSYTSPLIFLWCILSCPCILYNKFFAPSCVYSSPIHMSNHISIFPQLVHHVWHTHYIPNIFISNLIAPSIITPLPQHPPLCNMHILDMPLCFDRTFLSHKTPETNLYFILTTPIWFLISSSILLCSFYSLFAQYI